MDVSFQVRGRVQGVGFRWWTQAVAAELGVRGWVRNVEDGSVEVHAAGPEEAVRELERRLADGPAGARVRSVSAGGRANRLPASGFEIRR
jgi:acylphosphatase